MRSDYDLPSTYLGCDRGLAERLLRDETVEALEVQPETRIDWYCDKLNLHTLPKHWEDDDE